MKNVIDLLPLKKYVKKTKPSLEKEIGENVKKI
jgi:hypothetical protein